MFSKLLFYLTYLSFLDNIRGSWGCWDCCLRDRNGSHFLIEFFIWHLFIAKNETQLQFYLTILYFLRALEPAAEVLVDEAAEASAEVETAEFEFNTSSMKPLNETQLQF